MTSENGEGAASAAPSTPQEAEQLLLDATTPEQAWAIYEISDQQSEGWRAVKLKAERRYGELLGPAMSASEAGRKGGQAVSDTNRLGGATKVAQHQARKVAAIPEEKFNLYLVEESNPTRAGLLREHGEKKPRKPSAKNSDKPDGLWQDEQVLAWVKKRMAAKKRRDDMVEEAKAGLYDWPIADKHLPQNAADQCIAIIKDRARRPRPKKPSDSGIRLRSLYEQRKIDDNLLIDAQIDLAKLVGHLEVIDFDQYGVRDAEPDTLADIYRDLTRNSVWLDLSIPVVADAIDDLGKVRLIRDLRNTTGRTPEEAAAFIKMADKLEAERHSLTA